MEQRYHDVNEEVDLFKDLQANCVIFSNLLSRVFEL